MSLSSSLSTIAILYLIILFNSICKNKSYTLPFVRFCSRSNALFLYFSVSFQLYIEATFLHQVYGILCSHAGNVGHGFNVKVFGFE